jgi:hypothetical protein
MVTWSFCIRGSFWVVEKSTLEGTQRVPSRLDSKVESSGQRAAGSARLVFELEEGETFLTLQTVNVGLLGVVDE